MDAFLARITPLGESELGALEPGPKPMAQSLEPRARPPVSIIGPTIKAGESLSDGLNLTQGDLLKITMPSDWTLAPLSFQLSPDGDQYHDLFYLNGFEVTLPIVVPNTVVIMPYDTGRAIAWIKFRSGSKVSPIIQEADRTFTVEIS